MRSFKRRPSPSMVISLVALVVAMGGTATAAGVLIKSSSQIKNGVVTSSDIKNGAISRTDIKDSAIDAAKIANGSVGIDDLASPTRAAIQNAGTQAIEGYRLAGPSGQEPGKESKVATLANIPAGVYAIFAKTVITATPPTTGLFNQGQTLSGHCKLDAGGDTDESRALLGTPGANSPGEITTQITHTYSQTGSAVLTCDVGPATWGASNTTIIAMRLGAAPRSAVDG